MDNKTKPDDGMKPTFVTHLIIRDKESQKILLNQRGEVAKQMNKDTRNAVD